MLTLLKVKPNIKIASIALSKLKTTLTCKYLASITEFCKELKNTKFIVKKKKSKDNALSLRKRSSRAVTKPYSSSKNTP
ncbi:hypothetical protein HBI77_012970 [Parastagonospora nodorum]|nr:hypothetical protein HBI77_012970 [Parastagonospora nodorum]